MPASSMSSASAARSSTSHPLASATSRSARRSSSRSRRRRSVGGQAEAVAAGVAHGQGEHERRAAALVDRAHHRGEVVGATGGDLDRAHRAGPHRPAVLQSAVGRRPGAVLVRDHPQRRAGLWAADLVAALLDPLQLRDPAELAAAGPAVPATGLGTLLALLLDGLGALARTTSTPRAARSGVWSSRRRRPGRRAVTPLPRTRPLTGHHQRSGPALARRRWPALPGRPRSHS